MLERSGQPHAPVEVHRPGVRGLVVLVRCKVILNTFFCIRFLTQQGGDLRTEKNDVPVVGPDGKRLVISVRSGLRMAQGEIERGHFAREADVLGRSVAAFASQSCR